MTLAVRLHRALSDRRMPPCSYGMIIKMGRHIGNYGSALARGMQVALPVLPMVLSTATVGRVVVARMAE